MNSKTNTQIPDESSRSYKRIKLNDILPVRTAPTIKGTLLVCGMGDMGQLGLGEDENEKKRPTLVPTLKDIDLVDICAGGMHSLCLTFDGKLYSFGCNDEGALGRDTTTEEGSEFIPKLIQLPAICVKMTAGDSHSACLLADGRVFAWGSFRTSHGTVGLTLNGNEKLPIELMPNIKFSDISSGTDHLVMLTCNGYVYTVGCGEQGQLGRITLRSASGETRRSKTEFLQPNTIKMKNHKYIDNIWTTSYCTFVRIRSTRSKEIYGFGLNNYHQLCMNNKKNTSIVTYPLKTNLENISKICGGQHHTLSLNLDNNCFTLGRVDYGRLGLGGSPGKLEEKNDVTELTLIPNLMDVIDVTCGDAQSFAISRNGDIYAWGMGSNYQLGLGNDSDINIPTIIKSKQMDDKKCIRVASGGQHTLILIKNENNDYVHSAAAIAAANKIIHKNENKETSNNNTDAKVTSTEPSLIKTETGEIWNAGTTTDLTLISLRIAESSTTAAATAPAQRGRKRKH